MANIERGQRIPRMRQRRYTVPKANGGFPRKHRYRVDADLIVPAALFSNRVEDFMEYVSRYWRPKGDILLLSPCSNVKPYPLSPLNRKVEAAIKRLGVWDRVEWVFISDLLGPVPYELTWVSPACCYEARPDEVPSYWAQVVRDAVKDWWSRVGPYFEGVVVFLPRKYYGLVSHIVEGALLVRYEIFHGQKLVADALSSVMRA